MSSQTAAGDMSLTSRPQQGQKRRAFWATKSLMWSLISVIVPTVEREVRTVPLWSMAIAGGTPSILSTLGRSQRSRNCRA